LLEQVLGDVESEVSDIQAIGHSSLSNGSE
jgi:hypothetical protein